MDAKLKPQQLTQEQYEAVFQYARRGEGKTNRRWKDALREDWQKSQYRFARPGKDDAAVLQGLRNTRGPRWLVKFVFAKAEIVEPEPESTTREGLARLEQRNAAADRAAALSEGRFQGRQLERAAAERRVLEYTERERPALVACPDPKCGRAAGESCVPDGRLVGIGGALFHVARWEAVGEKHWSKPEPAAQPEPKLVAGDRVRYPGDVANQPAVCLVTRADGSTFDAVEETSDLSTGRTFRGMALTAFGGLRPWTRMPAQPAAQPEPEPEPDADLQQDRRIWEVDEITAVKGAKAGHDYRLHVQGTNLGHPDRPEHFSWTVHDVADPNFDLSKASIAPDAVPFLGRAK